MTLKNGFGKCSIASFIGQWVKRSKHGLFFFPPKKTLMWRTHCWHCWPIVLQYYVKAKYRLISRKFSGMKFFHASVGLTNQKPRVRVCIRSVNQSNRSISVCLSFLFCSRVFISRSYENLSIRKNVRPPLPGANARACSDCLSLTELASQSMTLKA